MIQAIPAIDIIGGQCVRLTRGQYDSKKVYADDPAAVAAAFERQGVTRLHVVDLDGAKARHIVNDDALRRITEATSLTVDFGGGIKTDDDLRKAFDAGASMVTIGSVAATSPDLFRTWMEQYGPDKIILGADAQDGIVAINGWQEGTGQDLFQFLDRYIAMGVRQVLCTDISKDGTLAGPATALYRDIMARWPELYLIASGGVSSNADIEALDKAGIPAVVFGKAYYEGKIDLKALTK